MSAAPADSILVATCSCKQDHRSWPQHFQLSSDSNASVCSNLEVFGSEVGEWDDETGESLAGCMLYRRRTWKGILPVNHLNRWAQAHQVLHAYKELSLLLPILTCLANSSCTLCLIFVAALLTTSACGVAVGCAYAASSPT